MGMFYETASRFRLAVPVLFDCSSAKLLEITPVKVEHERSSVIVLQHNKLNNPYTLSIP